MSGTLLDFWERNESLFAEKSFWQIIQFAGEGKFRDGNDTSREVRELLAAIPLDKLHAFANECLAASFESSGFALQDIVNQIGVRLGFSVQPGRYKGVKGEVGFDGLWSAKDGHVLVVEVKTTDAFRISLDTISAYRERLIKANELTTSRSSILIAVGRQDTGDLEAQIRGSKHAWDIRLISIDSLFRLAEVKEQVSDWTISNQINQILRPLEYTRLDQIVELLFATSQDLENPEPKRPSETETDISSEVPKANLESVRKTALELVSEKLAVSLVRKGRALRSTSDGMVNVVCLVSQRYDGPGGSGNYWYGFTPAQREFLLEADKGWIVLACTGTERCFMIARDTFLPWLGKMLTTPSDPPAETEIRHWHIYFNDYGDRVELMPAAGGEKRDIADHLISIDEPGP